MAFVEIAFSDLEFFEQLGGGASGTVYRGRWKSKNTIVAIKKLLLLEKEAEVLSSLSHRNIIHFFGAVVEAPNYCLVTEFAERGSLYDYLRKHTIEFQQILLWAKQIALGMNYLHNEAPIPVIHRDLKSSNVLIKMDLTAKICDFGSSKFHQHTTQMSFVGTFPWMAPEVIQQLPITPACDVFSYSIVLWELLAQEVPFKGLEGLQIAWLVVAKNERLTIPSSCPAQFSRLMKMCWAVEPKERPTFKQILDVLDTMLDNELLREETEIFLQEKEQWKDEIDAKLAELRSMELDLTSKQQELDKRERLLEMRLQEKDQSLRRFQFQVQQLSFDLSQLSTESWVISEEELNMTEEVLRAAAYGDVKVAIFRGLRVAAKSLHNAILSDYNLQIFSREMTIASRVRHPNLLLFIGATTTLGQPPIILTELMSTHLRGELDKHPLDNEQIKSIAIDVACGLNYLHQWKPHPIIHRDISSPNILLEPFGAGSWRAKISDFCSANFRCQVTSTSIYPGNPSYAAPEADLPNKHSPKMDVYSFGVLLTEMSLHQAPETTVTGRAKQAQMVQWDPLANVIDDCTASSPDDRPVLAQVIEKLREIQV